MAVLATAGLMVVAAAPAGAQNVTTQSPVGKDCNMVITFLGIPVFNLDYPFLAEKPVTAPTALERGATGEIRVTPAFHIVPLDFEGYNIADFRTINEVYRVGDGFEITGVSLQGGNITDAVASVSGNTVTASFPGPYPSPAFVQPPDVVIEVQAVGTVGTVGTFEFVSDRWSANTGIFLTGGPHNTCDTFSGTEAQWAAYLATLDPPLSIDDFPLPDPNGVLREIEILPGPYVQAPGPVVTDTTIATACSFNFNGYAANDRSIGSVPFSVTYPPVIPPGQTGTVTLTPGPYNWRAAVHAIATPEFNSPARGVSHARAFGFTIEAPAGFDVLGVSTSGSASASYDPLTGLITYVGLPGSGTGTTGASAGVAAPPPIQVQLEATGSLGHSGDFTVVAHGFEYRTVNNNNGTGSSGATWRHTDNGSDGGTSGGDSPTNTTPCSSTGSVATIGVDVDDRAPVAVDDPGNVVGNNTEIAIDVLANDLPGEAAIDPASVYVVDGPQHGSASVDPVTGVVTYTPDLGTPETSDGFTYLFNDVDGLTSNVATVGIHVVGLFCVAPCALDQFIEFDVDGAPLLMEQASANVALNTITLTGEPQPSSGLLNEVTVTNQRGDGAPWSLTGQVTDFGLEEATTGCPADDEESWHHQCIPGDNLGWSPAAAVGHDQVPGDVATVVAGAGLTEGLSSSARSLCASSSTLSGGTFTCGAIVTLLTPASAAAQVYRATLTLTLA